MNDLPSRLLRRVVSLRALIACVYAVLLPLAAVRAMRISSENGMERLIQPDDPDYIATRAFQKIFPDRPTVVLVFDADWSAPSLERIEQATDALRKVPHVSAFSVLDAVRRARPGASPEELHKLASGTTFFEKQGLMRDGLLSIACDLDVHSSKERDEALAGIDRAVAGKGPVRRVGAPYAQAWIEEQSGRASARYFPYFGALIVAATLFLYRSVRTLFAFLLTLATTVALAVAAGGLLGYNFTIVSVLVPLTVLVTTLAALVYLHSRFVDMPAVAGDMPAVAGDTPGGDGNLPGGVDLGEHQIAALRNKLLPVTASMVAAILGFAALAVSKVRPVRELGIWTAVGLAIAWVVSFTLFPALQRIFRTPTGKARTEAGLYERLAQFLPGFTFRHRWLFVGGAVLGSALGAAALFGIPGLLKPMSVGTDTATYIDPSLQLRRDLTWFRSHVGDFNVAHVWIHLPKANALEPETLLAADQLQTALERLPHVIQTIGPTTFLRLRRYFAGQGEALPQDPAQFAQAARDLEQLLLTEPGLRGYIDVNGLQDLNITVVFEEGDAQGYAALTAGIGRVFEGLHAQGFEGAQARAVGESLLQVKVGASLVPTLATSFAITAALIFVVFLFVFRSGTARLLAMIPSIFAILVTFLGMRLFGAPLNVATILIATTVLGTTETDQVHFFHHLHEREGAPLGEALLHALRVSGHAMVFVTCINAAGFLALSFSSFPPLRQFGLVTAAAFLLALVADFTALPAGLFIVDRLHGTAPGRPPKSTHRPRSP
ncbi:MAG TPA: MMPL family transporter [Myxococcales bacterium]